MLINLVQEKRELYDHSCKLYNDYVGKKFLWSEISECLNIKGVSGPHCKERWEQLRAQFRRNIRNKKNDINKWRYEDQMTFLKPFIKEKSRRLLLEEEDSLCSNTFVEGNQEMKQELDTSDIESVLPAKKIRLSQNTYFPNSTEENVSSQIFPDFIKNEINPIEGFFSLMATTVKKFDPQDQLNIKRQVFNIIMAMEEKYIILETTQINLKCQSTVDMPSSNT